MGIHSIPVLVISDQVGYFMHKGDEKRKLIQVVVDGNEVVKTIARRGIIAKARAALFFDLQFKVEFDYPFCNNRYALLRQILFEYFRIFLVLHSPNVHSYKFKNLYRNNLFKSVTLQTHFGLLTGLEQVKEHIVSWLNAYSESSFTGGFVIGISGGIDSAVTSTLCALTGKRVIVLNMPIRQFKEEFDRSREHIDWLKAKFANVQSATVDLSPVLESIENTYDKEIQDFLTMANTRARLRMTTLYAYATRYKLLVAGTGNKVEDFGVGFYTKYGDGGVDISPIADLYKTQVYALGKELGVVQSILGASPTDGLFADGRTDEDQIGATYPELEWAMEYISKKETHVLNARQKHVMKIYTSRHKANRHKMEPIPVCLIPKNMKI